MNELMKDFILNFCSQEKSKIDAKIDDMNVCMQKRNLHDLVIWSIERNGSGPGATHRFFRSMASLIPENIERISMEDVLNKNLEILLQQDGWEKGTLVPRNNRDIAALICPDIDELSYIMNREKFLRTYGAENA